MTDREIESRLANCALGDERGAFPAGTVIGDWRLTAFIAKGGTSEVYCARHATLDLSAAVKVLAEPLTDARKARFRREAKLLAELKSSAFPAFCGYGEEKGRPYLAEELLEPGELPTGDGARAKFLLALCAGLKTLHARGIVHRDIKPANILFRKDGAPVIIDLGLAKSVDVPLAPDGVSVVDGQAVGVGTPEYAAPEQFTGGDISPAADVHALGVLAERLLAQRRGSFSDSAWRNLIRRATSSIASERYQSVDEFAAAIRRRHRWRNLAVAGLLVACAAGVAAALAMRSRTGRDSYQAKVQRQAQNLAETSPSDRLATPTPSVTHEALPSSFQSGGMFEQEQWPSLLPRQDAGDPFAAMFKYEGEDVKGRKVYGCDLASKNVSLSTVEPVTVRGPALYKITGPGTFLANVDGEGEVEIVLRRRAALINFTKVPLKDSSIRYSLKDSAYLKFWCLRKEEAPDKLVYDPKGNFVEFNGGE